MPVVSTVVLLSLASSGAASSTRVRVALPQSLAFSTLPAESLAARTRPYGWPLRPFDRQHPIRGGFGDPRFGHHQRNFHFGIDIAAAGGTPVYSVSDGTVFLEQDHVDVLTRVSACCADGFSYWHITPAVAEHAFVPVHALLGWVKPMWRHVHFSELQRGRFVNPLRPGALTPYVDDSSPRIESVQLVPRGALDDVVVDAWVPSAGLEGPWAATRIAPTLIRWRLLANGRPVADWRAAVDFRVYTPPNAMFDEVYADGTLQNKPYRPGRYFFYLARNWDLTALPAGDYDLDVQAFGPRGAVTELTTAFAR